MFVIAVHQAARDGVLEWAFTANHSRGVPDMAPAAVPLPTVVAVLTAFDGPCVFRIAF